MHRIIFFKMRQFIRGGLFRNIIGVTDGIVTLEECDSFEADQAIVKYHYSKKVTKNRFLSITVNNGMGYIQLGYGVRPQSKHTISSLITKGNYAEFDRMWLSDAMPKFSESRTIGLLLRFIKQAYPQIKFIITYADSSVGNRGIIYQATNAFELSPVNVDFYILPDGERIHPVSMYHRHGTRAWATLQRLYPKIKHIKGTKNSPIPQYRFIYFLDKRLKKLFLREQGIRPKNLKN